MGANDPLMNVVVETQCSTPLMSSIAKIIKHYCSQALLQLCFAPCFDRDLSKKILPIDQFLYTYNIICEADDYGKEIQALLCDISKPFDFDRQTQSISCHLQNTECSNKFINCFLAIYYSIGKG